MLLTLFNRSNSAENISRVTIDLIKRLKVSVTSSTIVDQLEKHPDYPSLYSISDCLKTWRIDNLSMEVPTENLDQLPVPFIAHTNINGSSFLLVTKVGDSIEYQDGIKKNQIPRNEFLDLWTNIVLVAEAGVESGEKDYLKMRKTERLSNGRIPLIIAASLGLVFLFIFLTGSSEIWTYSSLLLQVKLAGCITGGLLLWFEIDKNNTGLKNICSAGQHTNCSAVINSKGSKLFNLVSWSEIGFIYFSAGFLFLLLGMGSVNSTFALLSWFNIFVLPYTIYSVYYQWRILKQWCRLCLIVQGLLVIEFVISYFGYWSTYQTIPLLPTQILPLVISLLLPVFFWIATKKVYLRAQAAKRFEQELSKVKYNKDVFQTLLEKQKKPEHSPIGLGIILGNPNASNTIIKVCNPYCGPCAKAHPVIDEILQNNEDVKVQIIFTATNSENDNRANPVKHLMALDEKKDSELIEKALQDWYGNENKNYDEFAAKYMLNGEFDRQGEKLNNMDKWCKETGIKFTPTFFINGHQLPEVYKVNDLKHLL